MMTLKKGKPKRYRYIVDLQAAPTGDYKKTYEAFGWEFVGQMASMFIWRKEYTDERPESFSDQESVLRRNKRVIWAVFCSFAIFALATIALIVLSALRLPSMDSWSMTDRILLISLCGLFSLYLGYVMLKIKKNIYK